MTEKTFVMFTPGKTPEGKGTYVEHKLQASSQQEAKVQAMALVRVLELKEMHIVQDGHLVFYSWPLKANG